MTDPTTYRTNRDLFSNHYLNEHLRRTEPWGEVDQEEVRETYEEVRDLWDEKKHRFEDYNESALEENFIRPMFDILGIPFEVEQTVERNARRPDYGFFPSEAAADAAYDREDFYEEAIAVADAKRWGRKLDTRGEEKRDFENPSYQIHAYIQETPVQWAVLTNGAQWRLYYGPTSHRLDSYYEIDLPELFEVVEGEGGLEDFKEFYLFFRQQAFLPDQSGDCFLDDVYDESSVFAEAIGEDLQDNIYEAIRVLAEGFLDTNDALDEDDLPLIHDSSLIYLYRLIFVLYAESEGRDLLPTDNDIYSESYSLNELKQTVADKRDETKQHYQGFHTHLWDRLEELFVLIDQGSRGKNIPKDQLYIPAYNGGLFRTNPDPDDSEEAQFLASHEADDAHLAEVLDLLTRRNADEGDGQVFVDYSSLDERHLGSIYEGLLEYKLDVADEPLTVEDEEYRPAGDGNEIKVAEGDVYLRTDAGERKATGSYYTPEYVVEYIVDETLGPLVDGIREDLVGTESYKQGGFAGEFADRVFDLKVLDPAMGSGHFLVNAVDYLAREIIDAQELQDQQAVKRGDEDAISDPRTEEGELRDVNWARRKVAQRCIYGVDLNPLATELAKVSLWLRTLAAEQPLAFLDHHLKTGNSLVGSDIEEVLSNGDNGGQSGQTQLTDWMDQARQRALEHVMERFTELFSIDNETLEDIKEMEEVYDEVRDDPLYQRLLAMANVYTAGEFGLDVPEDAEKQMAEALRDESWSKIENEDWFRSAQTLANEESFFHWELEYPVAFYNGEGERLANPGFDAVIGNPPYIIFKKISDEIRDYYRESFTTFKMKGDIYVLFTELATSLLREGGQTGYIIQNKFTKSKYGEHLREHLTDSQTIREIIDFNDSPVFDITAYPMILLRAKSSPEDNYTFRWRDIHGENPSELEEKLRSSHKGWDVNQSALGSDIWHPFVSNNIISVETHSLNQFAEQIGKGAISGKIEAYLVDEKTIEEENLESDYIKPVLRGGDVDQFYTEDIGNLSQFIYPYDIRGGEPELVNPKEIPNIIAHLQEFENDLLARKNYGKRLVDQGYEWYELQYEAPGMLNEKIVFPDISPENRFSYDRDGELACLDTVYYLVRSDSLQDYTSEYLTAILNSNLLDYLFGQMSPKVRGGYRRYKTQYVKSLPIPSIDFSQNSQTTQVEISDKYHGVLEGDAEIDPTIDEVLSRVEGNEILHNFLSYISEEMTQLAYKKKSLNLSLQDYLGNYTNGPKLPDVGLFQPTSKNILGATTKDYEKLQVENIRTIRDGQSVTIETTARYKPEDEDEFETDTYGYTETDYFEAFTLSGLTDEETALIEAFVPVAVEDEIGGFSDNATKTISLIDRLKDITLPELDDVQDDLQRYIETKDRANELDEKIDKADRLLNEIVYDLYDLTQEEIEIVEEAVNSD
jgi:type II restriction/modification system DNA methylase subunit YeeA